MRFHTIERTSWGHCQITVAVCAASLCLAAGGAHAGDFEHPIAPPAAVNNAQTDLFGDIKPHLAGDGQGVLVAAWESDFLNGASSTTIAFARSADYGATWSAPALLGPLTGTHRRPRLATDGLGTWVAVWFGFGSNLGGDNDIFFARSTDNGLTWSVPEGLNTDAGTDGADDQNPVIAADGEGNMVVAWQARFRTGSQVNDFFFDIFCARSNTSGAGWTAPAILNSNGVNNPFPLQHDHDQIPDIATDGQGAWLVVWNSQDSLGFTIGTDGDVFFAQSGNAGETWTDASPLNTNAATDGNANDGFPRIAMDSSGNAVCAWAGTSLGGTIGFDGDILMARSSNFGATWTDPQALNNNAPSDDVSDSTPSIATDGVGNWVTLWRFGQGTIASPYRLYIARSEDNGQSWTDPILFNTSEFEEGDMNPEIATDRLGNWLGVWDGFGPPATGSDRDIFIARFARPDCNENGIGDLQDIAVGASLDANNDGVPDECQSAPCPADITGDGQVNVSDLLFVISNWGAGPGNAADINGDGIVNVSDLLAVINAWGACP